MAKKKRALITCITGQDGSYLAEFLLGKNYEVHGLVRRVAYENEISRYSRMPDLLKKVAIHFGDVTDYAGTCRLLNSVKPDEIYHLAAQSFVQLSFEDDFNTMHTNSDGTHFLLRAIVETGITSKFYFAGSSEMFGQALKIPQDEATPFNPVSPYAISKTTGYYLTKMYRMAYGMFACNGILFNHESERRGENFVTRKITLGVAKIKAGIPAKIVLGNLDAKRDWGHARDYIEAMWLMLQQEKPEDFVIATGEAHSVREFTEAAFKRAGINLRWEGTGVEEKGIDADTGKVLVEIDSRYFRPAEVDFLQGDATKAKEKLGWTPKIKFQELVNLMVDYDVNRILNIQRLIR